MKWFCKDCKRDNDIPVCLMCGKLLEKEELEK